MRKERITRHKAEEWLGATINKRKIRPNHVARYAKDMQEGRWNPDISPPILIDEKTEGVLNGVHRLTAFLSTDLTDFESYVHHAPFDAMALVDIGPPRNLIDTLEMRGHEHATYKSAWLYRGFQWVTGDNGSLRLSREEQVEIIEEASSLEKAVLAAKHLNEMPKKVVRVPMGTSAVLWDISEHGYGGDTAVDFCERLQTSQNLTRLMGRLQARMQEAKNYKSKFALSPDALSYLIARVFIATINEETLDKLYARRNSLRDLPGWADWEKATFGDRFK